MSACSRTLAGECLALGAVALFAWTGCASEEKPSAGAPSTPTSAVTSPPVGTTSPEAPPTALTLTPVHRSPDLDAIGVIGNSGATGYDTNGDGQDVPANSWITGDNPAVDSIYLRLLADHPALEGHAWNEAISGSDVTSLMSQAEALLVPDPVPDIVFVVSINNDIRCDGTDEENYDRYQGEVTEVVDYLQGSAPGLKEFFNQTPFSVHQYDAALLSMDGGAAHIDWPGPCDPVTDDGQIDAAGEAYQQRVFDEYYKRLLHICATHTDCATDEGALMAESFTASSQDFTEDLTHLTVSGLARQAAVVWDHVPPEWKAAPG